jgi:hypothetical protein
MTYKREGDQVTLGMDIHQFNWLLILVCFATDKSQHTAEAQLFYNLFAFLNEDQAPEKAKLQ